MYDIFYVSLNTVSEIGWAKIKNKYPQAQQINHVNNFDQIKAKAFTKMFWVIWDDVDILDTFDLIGYRPTKWDDQYVHVFKNGDNYDGICLFPKSIKISNREFYHRFFTEKKEIDIVASIPKRYPIYQPKTYQEYVDIKDEMFWLLWPEITVIDNNVFDLYFSHQNSYDRRENHVFKNLCNGRESFHSGLLLCSKYKQISSREFDNQYLVDKKEHDQVVSKYVYPKYTLNNYDDYVKTLKEETHPLFWCVWPEVEVINNDIFDLYFDPKDGKYDHDRNENHVFKNLCNGQESYYNGIVLFSKNKPISKKEFERRYLVNKKEHDQVVSKYVYPRYTIDTYDQYLDICKTETHPLFWCVWPEVEVINNDIFDLYFDPKDGKYDHDRNENHVFKHLLKSEETFNNGVVLFSKNKKIGKKEFDHRFLVKKKEHNILASKMKPYDIVFISYTEPNADENYQRLLEKFPNAKRVNKVKGIHQAHIKAAKLCKTEMFWVVDGDAEIVDEFNFDYELTTYERDIVYVWRSKNPINNLIYGYGGVKLLPRQQTLDMNINTPDMTTAISHKFKAVPIISNVTAFNTDPFNTWKSAFRECVKLSSKIINRQKEIETQERLDIWCLLGKDQPFGEYAINGAIAGKEYGLSNKDNPTEIKKINDFQWLKEYYEQRTKNIHT